MFCTNCGKEIATGCRFCTNCGTPVNTNPDNNPVIVNQDPLQSETTVTSQSETPIEPPVTHQNDSTFNNGQFTQTTTPQNTNAFHNGQFTQQPTTPQNTNAFDNGQFTQQPAAPQNTNAFDNEQFTQTPDSNNELPKQASSKKKILLISLIVLLVAAAAVGTAVLLKSNHIFDKSEQTTEASQTDNQKNKEEASVTKTEEPTTENATTEPSQEPTPTPATTSTPTPTVDPKGVHSYKVVKKNCTWKDANDAAAKKNSHLATINSNKEWKAILKVAKKAYRQKGITVFWLGAKRSSNDLTYYWQDTLQETLDFDTHWLEGEPSYYDPDIEKDECYVELLYVKSKRKWVLNDAPNNITKWFSDKIGYIVETEE